MSRCDFEDLPPSGIPLLSGIPGKRNRPPGFQEPGGTGSGTGSRLLFWAISSAGSERTPHTRKVVGSIPTSPTWGIANLELTIPNCLDPIHTSKF